MGGAGSFEPLPNPFGGGGGGMDGSTVYTCRRSKTLPDGTVLDYPELPSEAAASEALVSCTRFLVLEGGNTESGGGGTKGKGSGKRGGGKGSGKNGKLRGGQAAQIRTTALSPIGVGEGVRCGGGAGEVGGRERLDAFPVDSFTLAPELARDPEMLLRIMCDLTAGDFMAAPLTASGAGTRSSRKSSSSQMQLQQRAKVLCREWVWMETPWIKTEGYFSLGKFVGNRVETSIWQAWQAWQAERGGVQQSMRQRRWPP